MKRNIIKYAQWCLLLATLSIAIAGCKKDIFDKKDLNGVDPSIWDTPSAAELYLDKTYDLVMPNWPTPGSMHNSTDELNNTTAALLYGQLTDNSVIDIASTNKSPSIGGGVQAGNAYFNIRRINLALQGIAAGGMDPDVKARFKGQFYFLRAYTYFNLVKLYGGVPLVLTSQDVSTDTLNIPRAKTSDCIKQIVQDLDSCYALPATWNATASTDGGRITKDAALAYKGKVLMYWASPQFNPNDDQARWQAAYTACKLAYTTALADGYDLMANFANIFTDETTNNKERMIWRTLDNVTVNPTRGTNTENITRPVSETTGGSGSNQPTWNLVTAFPGINGVTISDATSGYDAELFWKNRDPRFDATIAYNGCTWNLSGKSGRKQWTYTSFLDDAANASKTGFYCRKICNPTITASGALYNTNSGGGSGMDWLEMRFAEVLLNYAESANGALQMAECKTAVAKLRARAGITQAPYNYGLDKVTTRDSMFRFLLKEREIEFAMEGKRYDDLRRTRTFDKLTGIARRAFVWTVKSPYVAGAVPGSGPVAGKIYIDVADALGFKIRDTINVNNRTTYEKFFIPGTASIEPAATPVINYPTTYYFYPLPLNFRNSSPLIQQTIGWPGGTFDPLQ